MSLPAWSGASPADVTRSNSPRSHLLISQLFTWTSPPLLPLVLWPRPQLVLQEDQEDQVIQGEELHSFVSISPSLFLLVDCPVPQLVLHGDHGDHVRQGSKLHPCLTISPSLLVLDCVPPPQLTVHTVHGDQVPAEDITRAVVVEMVVPESGIVLLCALEVCRIHWRIWNKILLVGSFYDLDTIYY